jgi:DNA primase
MKVYIDNPKYVIVVRFTVDGKISVTDIIGTIFTMMEGYFKDLNLKELQQKGKVGRIEVDLESSKEISQGYLYIPTLLDLLETCILAASIETINKVGAFNAKFEVVNIEDKRRFNKEYIYKRAKEIAQKVIEESLNAEEIIKNLKKELLKSMIKYYGVEKLPGGPNLESKEELILVEGKADVNNLLEKGYTNVLGIEGKYDATYLRKLIPEKEAILFVDSDKGGEFIIREMLSRYPIDYVALSLPGKEVEELSKKEIEICLRNKIPADFFITKYHIQKKRMPENLPKYIIDLYLEEVKDKCKALILDENGNIIYSDEVDKFLKGVNVKGYYLLLDANYTSQVNEIAKKIGVKCVLCNKKICNTDIEVVEI